MIRFARRGLGLRAPGLLGPELVCVASADGLFWGHGLGLSIPLFCAVVAMTAWTVRVRRVGRARSILSLALLVLSLAPTTERLSPLSLAFTLLGTALSVHLGSADRPVRWIRDLWASMRFFLRIPVQAIRDLRRRRALLRRRSEARVVTAASLRWLAWTAPVGLFAIFLMLLASANPLISDVLLNIPLDWIDLWVRVPRMLFWLLVLVAVWPAVRVRRRRLATVSLILPPATDEPSLGWERFVALLLSPEAVLRAFVLLDVLFSLQIGLDGAYLWGGLALPRGVTYAGYAHRGAYPLMLTALLAAALVLVVRRPGSASQSRGVSVLLAVFLAENVLLVVSAMQRLDLYVAAYGLTEWRVAAFAWMGLVIVGLGLIGLQGALGRGNRWLVDRSALAALAVLYGWCFIDVPGIVADYDVAHCAELQGAGPALDTMTIQNLGATAIPAIDRFMLAAPESGPRDRLTEWRARQAADVRRAMADWRSWSVEGWRLSRYLDRSNVYEPAVSAPDDGGDG